MFKKARKPRPASRNRKVNQFSSTADISAALLRAAQSGNKGSAHTRRLQRKLDRMVQFHYAA